MNNFVLSLNYVLKFEGRLEEDKADPGGITNFGISLRFLREIPKDRLKKYGIFGEPDAKTIINLTTPQVTLIYRGEFWENAPFEVIDAPSLIVNYIFDMCVNSGLSTGIKICQRSLWAVFSEKDRLKIDGILGEKTLAEIACASTTLFYTAMQAQRDAFYRHIVELNPSREGELDGWLRRCYNQ